MARLIVRTAYLAATAGLSASIVGHLLSFHPEWSTAPAWFIAAMIGIIPIGWVGVFVCLRLDRFCGVSGADKQWAYFDERLPKWLTVVRTGLFFYAFARFAWFAFLDISGSPADDGPPLGLFSTFGMIMYLTLVMVFHIALREPDLIPRPGGTVPSQSAH